jgi:recombination protein RecA
MSQANNQSVAAKVAVKPTQSPVPHKGVDPEKLKALQAAVATIEKQFGKGSIMRLGENQMRLPNEDVIPTGSLGLDLALGIGGIPRGRIVEIFGPESSGKTTLTLHLIAECQKKGGICAFVDAEHAIDVSYAKLLGVNIDDLLISQPDTGEEALEIVDALIRSNVVDLIIVDSVAALTPKAEIEGSMGDSHMGLQARLMSQALRKLTGTISKSKTTLVFINQIRMKIGVMFGNPETTTGGNALKFYSSVRLDIRRTGALKLGEEVVGNKTTVKVVKNKVAAPFKKAEFDIVYGKGIDRDGEIADKADEFEIIQKSGSWYSYNGEKIGQGREAAIEFLKTKPEVKDTILKQIYQKLGLTSSGANIPAGSPGAIASVPAAVAKEVVAKEVGKDSAKKPSR